jgi:hypothetical protein
MGAVDVAIEIEQVHFQHRLQARRHGGAHADAGGAGFSVKRLRLSTARDGNREHRRIQRQALAPQLDVGRRESRCVRPILLPCMTRPAMA